MSGAVQLSDCRPRSLALTTSIKGIRCFSVVLGGVANALALADAAELRRELLLLVPQVRNTAVQLVLLFVYLLHLYFSGMVPDNSRQM